MPYMQNVSALTYMQSDEADDGSDNEECLQPPCRTPLRDVPVPLTNSNKKHALEGVTIAGPDSKKQAGNSTSAAVRHQPALISPDIAQKEPECTASTASEPAGGGGRTAVEEPSASLPIIIITAPIMKEALKNHQVVAMAATYGIRSRVGARTKSKDELIAELVGMNLSTPLPGCPAWQLLYTSLVQLESSTAVATNLTYLTGARADLTYLTGARAVLKRKQIAALGALPPPLQLLWPINRC